jgi:hypothetical protein
MTNYQKAIIPNNWLTWAVYCVWFILICFHVFPHTDMKFEEKLKRRVNLDRISEPKPH